MMIYSSDLGRSLKSAQIIGDIIAAPVDATNQLREVHFGVFQGLTDLEIQKRYPNEFAAFSEDCIGYNIPGGESSLQAQHRVMAFLESIAVTHQGKTVAVIGHAGTINSLRWCMESRIAIKSSLNCVENGSIFEFEWTAGNWNLLTRVA
jgi:probable phosphoglycerate mutase